MTVVITGCSLSYTSCLLKSYHFWRCEIYSAHADALQAVASDKSVSISKLLVGQLNSEFWSLSANYHRKFIYYTDYYRNFIGVYNKRDRTHKKLYQGLAYGIDSLSVDWVTNNVYWTDTDTKWIMMGNEDLSKIKHVVAIASNVPAIVAVHPLTRTIYWSEVTVEEVRLLQKGMGENNVIKLHSFYTIVSIDSLIIDVIENRVYWGERIATTTAGQYIARVRSMSTTNTSDIRVELTSSNSWFMGLSVYKDFLYVANSQQISINVVNRTSGQIHTNYLHQRNVTPRTVVVYSPDVQPQTTNPCSAMQCSHLCTPTNTSAKCVCTTGYQLMADGKSCSVELIPDNFFLLSDSTHGKIYQVQFDVPTTFASLPLSNVGKPHSVDYDEATEKLYWSDSQNKRISRSDLNGDNMEIFMDNVNAYSIAIDPVSRNLYFADAVTDSIVVMSLDIANVSKVLQVHDMNRVWELHVDAKLGKIFWSDWGQQLAGTTNYLGLIESVNLDGSGRSVLVNLTTEPHGLTTDTEGQVLYWSEASTGKVGWYNLITKKSGSVSLGFKKPNLMLGIEYYAGYVYVTDTNQNSLHKIPTVDIIAGNVTSTSVSVYGPAIFFDLSAVKYFSKSDLPTSITPCSTNRGGCPQICLPTPTGHQCECADHHTYIAGNNTCVPHHTKDEIRPTFGSTCPSELQVYSLDKCSTTAFVNYTVPTATDNSGTVVIKANVKGTPPYLLPEGTHFFQYKAQDLSGNLAICSFIVRINSITCISPASNIIPEGATQSLPSCGLNYGSTINVTCAGEANPRFQYECTSGRMWEANGIVSCDKLLSTTTTVSGVTKVTVSEPITKLVPLSRKPSSTSGGIIALIVIMVILALAAVGIFLAYRYKRTFRGVIFWKRGEDAVQLTETNYCSPEHDTYSTSNIYVTY
uniref:low-density lipoprotein receptor-related protein 6-like isoform X3 n=1 Tax=Ciona intestinalis TaxID=7719 RepID=UPI000521858C|nr:low-density lipoprotein receptor-related protein 6-like isoform X3 [Ciona intestinalis]|eukprot:XP_026691269.1 low-density lipoprotein receptor-related protein 6-like isoform X3 [Ciona intestinalis]